MTQTNRVFYLSRAPRVLELRYNTCSAALGWYFQRLHLYDKNRNNMNIYRLHKCIHGNLPCSKTALFSRMNCSRSLACWILCSDRNCCSLCFSFFKSNLSASACCSLNSAFSLSTSKRYLKRKQIDTKERAVRMKPTVFLFSWVVIQKKKNGRAVIILS